MPTDVLGLVADEADGAVVALGGGNGSPVGSAWAWTGTGWARLMVSPKGAPAIIAPHPSPARQFAASVYDERRDQVVLFGGVTQTVGSTASPINDWDTWTLGRGRWTRSLTATHPPSTGPMAYDSINGAVIIVADANGPGFTGPGLVRPETWTWDGQTWRPLHPLAELPAGTLPVAMVADPVTRTVVAISACCENSDGSLNSAPRLTTWTWNGRAWTNARPKTEFGGGLQVLLAYDSSSRRVLGVGGTGEGPVATWAWDGSTWTELHPANPLLFDPLSAVMAGDPATGGVVLVERRFQAAGTFIDAGGTVVWDGTTWRDHLAVTLFAADTSYGNAVVYDNPSLDRLVLVSSTSHDYSEEWMWTGTAWLQLTMG